MFDRSTLLITGPGPFEDNTLKLIDLATELKMKVVVSTWDSSRLYTEELLQCTEVIYSKDCQSGPGYEYKKTYKDHNFDRQFILMNTAREVLRGDFVIRVRSDIYLNLIKLEKFMCEIVNGHTLTLDVSSVNPKNILSASKLLYHPCDWMYATSRQQFELFLDRASRYYNQYVKSKDTTYCPVLVEGHNYLSPMAAEQMLWASFLGVSMSHRMPRVGQGLVIPHSSIGMGVITIEGKQVDLISNKQRLRILPRSSASYKDTHKYTKCDLSINSFIRQVAYYVRKFT